MPAVQPDLLPMQSPDATHARRALGRVRAGLFGAAMLAAAMLAWATVSPAQAAQAESGAAPTEQARTGPVRVDAVEVELVSRHAAIVPGRPLELGLRIEHDPHWHTYWRNPGDSGLATQLELSLPEGLRAGGFEWPAPQRLFIPPLANYGYEGEIVLPLRVEVPATLTGESLRVEGKAFWLMCRDVCIPGEASLALELPVSRDGASPGPSTHAALFVAARERTPDESLEVAVAVENGKLSLGLPQALPSAEFFPYREGLIGNAAPQVLYASEAPQSQAQAETQPLPRRLELQLSAEGLRALAADPQKLLAAAEGVLVSGDRIFELRPTQAAQPLEGGTIIARVEGAPPTAGASGIGQGGTTQGSGFRLPGLGAQAPFAGAPSGPGGAASGSTGSPGGPATAGGASALALAALFAAIGGLILNLMPCVFPVIGLKVLGFARHGGTGDPAHADAARSASRASALAFSAGVLVSFWLLAALLLVLRAAGQAAGWGFQLQSPVFVAAMALLFVAIALNFAGVFELGTALTRLGQHDPVSRPAAVRRDSPLAGSFGSGALAVLVATPCTAPFMGSALGFTLSAGVAETLVVFTALGAGMALPYLLLGLFPGWLRWLPRPGRWMESFRQALAFPMFVTAAWLAWVLGRQVGIDAVLALSVGAVLVALAAWLYGRFVQRAQPARVSIASGQRRRLVAGTLAALALACGLFVAWPGENEHAAASAGGASLQGAAAQAQAASWQPWSREAVEQALAAGRPVFVDFTAAWCVSCQVNKQLVLDRSPVVEAMQRADVLRLRADWTSRDREIGAELARHGRNGVPLYLLFAPDSAQPEILPELLTQRVVLDALAALGGSH